ncbi:MULTISPECIES: nucleotidyltransferase domain-containing protein [Xanthomonas]|uniref:nucleotidyltransferase domain-containing protein n=1 Tax=Xanthomonas TaxID=338 RepID=UPI0011B06AC8|nr:MULTISPECIES: nucleotidyltransferase domain-containing protein [Xanthomonas]MCF8818947.1 nucleotidyltransferase domain-containing protein [Xanthomonas campestris]
MANFPANADKSTVDFVVDFCERNLAQYGLHRVYLFGSRASGVPRRDSDHDFYAVVADTSPDGVRTGGIIHDGLYRQLLSEARTAGIGKIDLMISRDSGFNEQSAIAGTHANSAVSNGLIVFNEV